MSVNKEMIDRIGKELRKADPKLKPDDEGYKAAAVLLASLEIGPNPIEIGKALGYPRSLLSKFNYHLRRNGIWKQGKVRANWDDPEEGMINFWLSCLVAQGLMEKARS